jgi:hypothetical protein
MDFKRVGEDFIEIALGELSAEVVLEEMARLSYETANSPLPNFAMPFDIPSSLVDFGSLITDDGLQMDFLNGRLCSTHVEIRGERLIFDAKRFSDDRGSPEVFLILLRENLKTRE